MMMRILGAAGMGWEFRTKLAASGLQEIARDRQVPVPGGGLDAVLVSAQPRDNPKVRHRRGQRRGGLDADAPALATHLIALREVVARRQRIVGLNRELALEVVGDRGVDVVVARGALAEQA